MNSSSFEVLHLPQVKAGSKHVTYYITMAAILAVVWLIQTAHSKRQRKVIAPFYKAGLLKWMFDAENLILDSYGKVRAHSRPV